MPQRRGNTSSSGIRNSTCRVMERNIPLRGLPMAAKKLEESICTPLMSTISRNTRMNRTANW